MLSHTLTDDLDRALKGDVLYMVLHRDDVFQFNEQSCDCSEVIIVMADRILVAVHDKSGEDGEIRFSKRSEFKEEFNCFRVIPRQGSVFKYLKVRYDQGGAVDGVKYQFGDRYIFISATEDGLIVTKSMYDLFEEDDTPMPDWDTSVLFEEEH